MEAEKNAILRVASETYSCVAAPIQHAAVAAYALDDEDLNQYKINSARILEAVGNRTTKKLLEHGVKVHYPEGGFYVYPDFSNYKEAINSKLGTNSSIEFFKIMLEQTGVSLLAGGYFNSPDENNFCGRLAFVDFNGE